MDTSNACKTSCFLRSFISPRTPTKNSSYEILPDLSLSKKLKTSLICSGVQVSACSAITLVNSDNEICPELSSSAIRNLRPNPKIPVAPLA